MYYDPILENHGMRYNPFKALVTPRPIGWISTLDKSGNANLAPYSFFNAVAADPPYVVFGVGGHNEERPRKDSAVNAEETGEFVVNIVGLAHADQMNRTAHWVDPGVDEFEFAGLEKEPSVKVAVPRVKGAPAHLECIYDRTVLLPSRIDGFPNSVVFGRVVGVHIDDSVINEDGRVDVLLYRPVARMGYLDYTSIGQLIQLEKYQI
ncbi:MAG: flavin reductase family protein [Salinarimonadaceae bacterium]|nr:MAG: flavin reductase family protein [Salinarimonadaceae bacterium]